MYVYFIDTEYFIKSGYISKITEYIKEKLPECLLMRISDTKNEKRRNERILAYYLFSLALDDLDKVIPEIEFSENGKPYSTDRSLSFSISHTDGLAAVAIGEDISDVGIDAELITKKSCVAAEKFLKKYAPDVSFRTENISASLKLCFASGRIRELSENDFCLHSELSPIDKWTLSEAALKCDGRGICAIGDAEKISSGLLTDHKRIKVSDRIYSVSIAKKKE